MKHLISGLILVSAALLSACNQQEPNNNDPAMTNGNPLLSNSTLYMQYPPFDAIADDHYKPALEAGMKEQLDEILAIASNPEPPTFENTIVALERSFVVVSMR